MDMRDGRPSCLVFCFVLFLVWREREGGLGFTVSVLGTCWLEGEAMCSQVVTLLESS